MLLQINKNKPVKHHDSFATVKVGHEKLVESTGYSKNAITKAIKELQNRKFIEPVRHRKKHGEFGANEYMLCHPGTGIPLTAKRDVVYGNGLPYFTFPERVIKEHTTNCSLAKMSSSELRLYTCILYLANRHRNNEFTTTAGELRKLSGLAPTTFRKALEQLECRGLVWVTASSTPYRISLCDPYTGQPLHEQTGFDEDDPANYFTMGDKGQAKRLNFNTGDPVQVEKLVRSCVSEEPVMQGNGDLMIRCPFHADANPSCSVSPKKNGCFHCFGCGKNGSLTELVMQLKSITKGEAIQQTATAMGMKTEFHEPDKRAIAKYSYRNASDKLLKQVLQYPDENGQKAFRQRRPAKGDWIWNTAGLPPMLFNMDLLKFADVVCITEGEKDATTVTELHLLGNCGLVIGVTSGGA
jgi:DNA-binding MarR family transcriptional regulator